MFTKQNHKSTLIYNQNAIRRMPQQQSPQYPNWCFTFHYGATGQVEEDGVRAWWDLLCTRAHYAIAGFELGGGGQPDESGIRHGGTRHLQGYVQFASKQRLEQLKKIPGGTTVHWESAKGDEQDNIKYCSKEGGEILTHGDEPRVVNGGRREKERWDTALALAKEGEIEGIDSQIQITQCRNLEFIYNKHRPKPDNLPHDDIVNLWLWGPSGSGKSRNARERFDKMGMEFFDKAQNKWWCGYRNEPAVLVDDLEEEQSKYLISFLKRWLDIYPFSMEYKGAGAKAIRPKVFIITSNYHPWTLYGHKPEWYDPIARRCRIVYVGPEPEPNPKGELILPEAMGSLRSVDQTPEPARRIGGRLGPTGTLILRPETPAPTPENKKYKQDYQEEIAKMIKDAEEEEDEIANYEAISEEENEVEYVGTTAPDELEARMKEIGFSG